MVIILTHKIKDNATISVEMLSTASRYTQEHDHGQQSHVGLLSGLTEQRNDARDKKEEQWQESEIC